MPILSHALLDASKDGALRSYWRRLAMSRKSEETVSLKVPKTGRSSTEGLVGEDVVDAVFGAVL